MPRRPKHPNKDIEAAIRYAEDRGWDIRKSTGGSAHAWGMMYCRFAARGGHHRSIYSTPTSPWKHARDLMQEVDRCTH